MNEMRPPTKSSLKSFVGIISCAVAACSGAGSDALVTVGIRPTGGIAAVGGAALGDVGEPSVDGSDAMNQTFDGDSTTARGVAATGASRAPVGTPASAGSGTVAEIRGIADSFPAAADAGSGVAGMGGSGGRDGPNEDECGAIPSQPAGKATTGRVSGPGLIGYDVDAPNVFTALRTTLSVPAEPPPSGAIFIWPGIQPTPNGMNFQPIGNGALLPVLTWGTSCAPDGPPSYSTWSMAPTYSNISSSDPQYSGCHAGKAVPAQPGQFLDIEIRLEGTDWVENVVNRDTMEASDFSLDLKGQAQGRVFFDIELQTSNKPTEDIIFTNTVLTMEVPDPNACQPVMRGMNDFASKPRVSTDGKHCCIDLIVLRAPGVEATTTDPP